MRFCADMQPFARLKAFRGESLRHLAPYESTDSTTARADEESQVRACVRSVFLTKRGTFAAAHMG